MYVTTERKVLSGHHHLDPQQREDKTTNYYAIKYMKEGTKRNGGTCTLCFSLSAAFNYKLDMTPRQQSVEQISSIS